MERVLLEITLTALVATAFGSSCLASSDFDGDGRDDLVIPAVGQVVAGLSEAGAISVLYGSGSGVTAAGDQYFDHATPGVMGSPRQHGQFGHATAAGDFDGDGRDDLAIGSPYVTISGVISAGEVNVLYGTDDGLSVFGDQLWHRDVPHVAREPEGSFGEALAAGDFDGDGFDDLVVGVPFETLEVDSEQLWGTGTIHVFYGSTVGLTADRDKPISLHNSVPGTSSEPLDRFGRSLAVGDFNHDGIDDLAAGMPNRYLDDGADQAVGAVAILYGTPMGLGSAEDRIFHQESPGMDQSSEAYDTFAAALIAGDFDGDGADDLAVGVPGEDDGTFQHVGQVVVLFGGNSGLSTTGVVTLQPSDSGGVASNDVYFGRFLAAGDFDDDGRDDLVVAAPGEAVNGISDAGSVRVFRGHDTGLEVASDLALSRATPGIPGSPKPGERFGSGLLTGDYDGDGRRDLCISVPGATVSADPEAGLVVVLYGSSSSVLLGNAEIWSQNTDGVIGAPAPGKWFGWRPGSPVHGN